MSQEISGFLKSQSSSGQYESSGSFTLDTLRMGRKLAGHQLPAPGLWLVKLVQAAVALETNEIKISFGTRGVSISFWGHDEGPTAQEILEELFRPSPSPGRALKHLATGLRDCVARDAVQLKWEVMDAEECQTVTLTKDATTSTRSGSILKDTRQLKLYQIHLERPARRPPLKKALRQRVVDIMREVGEEYMEVVSRCWCCPVPINIDGIDLETAVPHPGMRHLTDCREVGCGVDRYHMGDHWLALRAMTLPLNLTPLPTPYWSSLPEGTVTVMTTPTKPKETFLTWPVSSAAPNALLLVSFASLAIPGVDFILDGAVVDQYEVPYDRPLGASERLLPTYQRQATGYRYFACVEPEQLDLSGFSVRHKEALGREILGAGKPQLEETLDYLSRHLEHYRFAPSPTEKNGRWFNRLLAPLARLNQGFTVGEARRTLGQLQAHLSQAGKTQSAEAR